MLNESKICEILTKADLFKNIIKQLEIVLKFNVMWLGDAASECQLGFQDPATTTMEGIYLFNLHLLFIIVTIVLFVGQIATAYYFIFFLFLIPVVGKIETALMVYSPKNNK